MTYIHRHIESQIVAHLQPGKAIMLVGARRVGKTELIKYLTGKVQEDYLLLNGGDVETLELLAKRSTENYRKLLGDIRLLIIDEAQEIPGIGASLKLMLDTIDGLKAIATGSSAFDLANQLGEPLVGRKVSFQLFPLAQMELQQQENPVQTVGRLSERLVLGSYPELEAIPSREGKIDYLKEIVNDYLLKDILAFEGVRHRSLILSLLRKIAYRIGSELSIEGLGNELGVSKNTVDRYLDLLTKVFIIHKVSGFSRNLDNEITKKSKWYFYDNGIRNALIANFNLLETRDDIGSLWENYLIAERLKFLAYNRSYANHYFWRTHRKQEIDWLEEKDGQLFAYEFKWNPNRKIKPPKVWVEAYPKAIFHPVTPDNYLEFIT